MECIEMAVHIPRFQKRNEPASFMLSVPTKCQNYNVIWHGCPSYILCILCDSRNFIIIISVNLSERKKALKYGSKILLLIETPFPLCPRTLKSDSHGVWYVTVPSP